ncbi:MAG: dipeptide ABC transporter ATP-binding protein [Sporolactobacillus sp.]|jgi:oligopeptide/dipeptide ABC transporter ATP-binding protein|nr:dipeptide ABC transporter ATP-binding protein [Sporolactobacillus sp.]
MAQNNIILRIDHLKQYYLVNQGWFKKGESVKAVDDVSFSIQRGEIFGLVGESGCGKSSTGRAILKLNPFTNGAVYFEGKDISGFKGKDLKKLRQKMQMIFQDPYASLDPRKKIQQILLEPLATHHLFNKKQRLLKVQEIVEKIGLSATYLKRYPDELSGGQRQRIAIARAVILHPSLIVADEPVSALDVSIQAQILNLMLDLQKNMNLTYLFISHDLDVVRHITDRIAVMYLGKIVEMAKTEEIFQKPMHPYTVALLSAIPVIHADRRKQRIILHGEVPSPVNPPAGCPFHERCPKAMPVCSRIKPTQKVFAHGHTVSCHLYDELND